MKNYKLIYLIFWALILSACSNYVEEPAIESPAFKDLVLNEKISLDEAIQMADKTLAKEGTRTNLSSFPEIEFITSESKTRSMGNDTLAYILNYPNETGFAIIATSRNVNPVLGFSDSGHFSLENEIAKENFIDNIEPYIQGTQNNSAYDINSIDFTGYSEVSPQILISIGQGYPWNKYVTVDHPNCPAGCVAIAGTLVASHCKNSFRYHGSVHYFKNMIMAINKGQGLEPLPPVVGGLSSTQGDDLVNPTYTYNQAVDSLAKIIYNIGKDIQTEYSPGSSVAQYQRVYNLLKSLGYNIPSGYANYNLNRVTQYLISDHLIFFSGCIDGQSVGHAWVGDGCKYKLNSNGEITDSYIHCDWGWNGTGNGYFTGEIFNVISRPYRLQKYFATKREW